MFEDSEIRKAILGFWTTLYLYQKKKVIHWNRLVENNYISFLCQLVRLQLVCDTLRKTPCKPEDLDA